MAGRQRQESPSLQGAGKRREPTATKVHELSGEGGQTPSRSSAASVGTAQRIYDLPLSTSGHELELLFPIIHSTDDAAAISPAPSPPNESEGALPCATGPPGTSATPDLPTAPHAPRVPLGRAPYRAAVLDAIAFLPRPSRAPDGHGPPRPERSLRRDHSLALSDADVQSVGSFANPFDEEGGAPAEERPGEPEVGVQCLRSPVLSDAGVRPGGSYGDPSDDDCDKHAKERPDALESGVLPSEARTYSASSQTPQHGCVPSGSYFRDSLQR